MLAASAPITPLQLIALCRTWPAYDDKTTNDMKDSIASTRILCIRPNGERLEVCAEIGRPYDRGDGAWACPVGLKPLYDLADIEGVDSLQALCLGASLIRKLLNHFVEDGGRILHVDNPDHAFDVDATFSLVGARGLESTD